MPETSSVTSRAAATGRAAGHTRRRHQAASARYGAVLARAWLVANLLAVAGVGAACGAGTHVAGLAAWALFVVLNAALVFAVRSGRLLGSAAREKRTVDLALAGIGGSAWGVGVAALLPLASPAEAAVLFAATLGVTLTAVPVFSNERPSFSAFVTPLALLATLAVLADARYAMAVLWLLPLAFLSAMMAAAYHRAFAELRAVVRRFLGLAEAAVGDARLEYHDDAELGALARRKFTALTEAFSTHDRNRRVLRALGDAVITTNAEGVIDYVNPVAEVLLGWDEHDLLGQAVDERLHIVVPPDLRNSTREIFDQCRLTRRSQAGNDSAQLARRDGVVYGIDYIVTPIRCEQGAFAGAAFLVRDVTERRHRAETIAWQATHDPLTGAINRTEFEVRLKKLVQRAQKDSRHAHCLLYIDVDKFKFVNDSYGHAAGDAVLKALSDILRGRIRGADTLARMGGDEFTALLYSCTEDKAGLIAESLRAAVAKYEFTWQDIRLPLSISVGLVEINAECRSAAEIIRAADSACYSAKKFGRNRVHVFERESGNQAYQARVFDFVKDIQTAIQTNRLELFYVPLCRTGKNGTEQLCELSVGVRRDDGEFIPQGELADLARRYQLAEEIDRWAVKAAVDALRLNHPTLGDMSLVLVPLSQQSLADDRLLEFVVKLVEENRSLGSRLGFAFDEPGFTGHLDHVRYFVTALKQYGCRFMVTDSGFGGESIELVKSLHADYLGIRGSLVQSMLYSSVDYEVVLGLTRIGHSLGMFTVAEDADTRPIREALAKMGVDYVKGHLNESPRPVAIHSEAQWI